MQNVTAIHGEIQHALVVADIDKNKIRNAVKKTCIERKNISLLNDEKIRKLFDEKVIELAVVGMQNLWGRFKDGVLETYDEVCGKGLEK